PALSSRGPVSSAGSWAFPGPGRSSGTSRLTGAFQPVRPGRAARIRWRAGIAETVGAAAPVGTAAPVRAAMTAGAAGPVRAVKPFRATRTVAAEALRPAGLVKFRRPRGLVPAPAPGGAACFAGTPGERTRHVLALRPGRRLGRGHGFLEPGDQIAPCGVLVALPALRIIPVRHVPTDVRIEACSHDSRPQSCAGRVRTVDCSQQDGPSGLPGISGGWRAACSVR